MELLSVVKSTGGCRRRVEFNEPYELYMIYVERGLEEKEAMAAWARAVMSSEGYITALGNNIGSVPWERFTRPPWETGTVFRVGIE